MKAREPNPALERTGPVLRLRRWLLRQRLAFARSQLGRITIHASRFQFVPPHLHLSDPSIAADFLAGQVVLAGRSILSGGRSIFDHPPPSPAFSIALHRFEWLRHFDASGDPKIRDGARAMMAQWLERRAAGRLDAAEIPETIPARLIALLTHSALLTENSSYEAYRRLVRHLNQDASVARYLAQSPRFGMLRIEAAVALCFHALSLDRSTGAVRAAEALLLRALAAGIDKDGAPRNRNSASLVGIAANLIPLLALYRARQLAPPEALTPILLRIIGFIRMMQHPDGGLALFAGGGLATRDLVAQITRFGAGRIPRLGGAPEIGFERLEDGHGVLIADTGRLPPDGFAGQAGASALAFEFSTKSQRIIVSCGIPASIDPETARGFLSAHAHSTLMVDDQPLVAIVPRPSLLGSSSFAAISPGEPVPAQRMRENGVETIALAHSGLLQATGYRIERTLTLVPGGLGLSGIDRAIQEDGRSENRRLTLAFHLHPRVMAVPLTRQDAIVLRLQHESAGRDVWIFEAAGLPLHLEESLCHDLDLGLSKAEAIILDLPISGTTEVRWRITPYSG